MWGESGISQGSLSVDLCVCQTDITTEADNEGETSQRQKEGHID